MSQIALSAAPQVGMMLADTVAEEGKSTIASLITQIINTVRTIIAYVMEIMRRFIQWTGEHPLASILTVANICIWVS